MLKFVDCLFVFVEARGGSGQFGKKVTFRSHSSKPRSQGHRRCTVKITLRMWSRHNQRNWAKRFSERSEWYSEAFTGWTIHIF